RRRGPGGPAPGSVAAEAYRRLGRAQDADAAAARARQLAACSEGAQVRGHGEVKVLPETLYRPEQRALASVIARDFFVVASCPDAGVTWLLRPLPCSGAEDADVTRVLDDILLS